MPDDPKPPEGETPPEPTPAPPTDPAPAGDEEFDKDRAMALIAKLREEAKDSKAAAKERDALAAKLKEREDADLSEQELVAKEREEAIAERDALRTRTREDAVKLAVFGVQQDKGLADAELALAALDRTKIEFDDQGQPTNVDVLIDDLLERKPLLKGTPPPPRVPSSDGGGGTGGGSAPDLTAEQLEAARATGMSPEDYARWDKQAKESGGSIRVEDAIAAMTTKG